MSERVLIESLEPWTKAKCVEHQRIARSVGLHTLVTAGTRSPQEQMTEFAKGRRLDPTGIWVVVDERLVVTRALPSEAPHCRAAAYDLWLLFGKPGEQHLRLATMDPKDGWTPAEIEQQTTLWGALVRIGGELGMEAGAHWPKLKDWPHFERPDWRSLPVPR
jgi:hypothetical protein